MRLERNAICDVCGLKFKASQLKRRWDNLMVCQKDFESRHPSEVYRPKFRERAPRWTRPDCHVEPELWSYFGLENDPVGQVDIDDGVEGLSYVLKAVPLNPFTPGTITSQTLRVKNSVYDITTTLTASPWISSAFVLQKGSNKFSSTILYTDSEGRHKSQTKFYDRIIA